MTNTCRQRPLQDWRSSSWNRNISIGPANPSDTEDRSGQIRRAIRERLNHSLDHQMQMFALLWDIKKGTTGIFISPVRTCVTGTYNEFYENLVKIWLQVWRTCKTPLMTFRRIWEGRCPHRESRNTVLWLLLQPYSYLSAAVSLKTIWATVELRVFWPSFL